MFSEKSGRPVVYFSDIRRPGPTSEAPRTGHEGSLDSAVHQGVKDDLVGTIAMLINGGSASSVAKADAPWKALESCRVHGRRSRR
jgi:hypothetical protein